jgi:hypothetical protein
MLSITDGMDTENAGKPAQPSTELTKIGLVGIVKMLRKDFDQTLQALKSYKGGMAVVASTEFEDKSEAMAQITLSQRDAESAIMRLGMVLKAIGNPTPYPESYNPDSPVVHPTADVKL